VKVFAVYNIKGGVGKTAAAVNLSYLSSRTGVRTLLWDLDPQGAATFYFRIEAKVKGGARGLVKRKRDPDSLLRGTDFEGLDLLPADFSYRNLDLALDEAGKPRKRLSRVLKPLAAEYEHAFLDCAPSISLVSESIFAAADVLLVPTIPTTLSLRTLDQLAEHLEKEGAIHLRVLPFFSMVDLRKAMHREVMECAQNGPFPFLETAIPYSAWVERMGIERGPVATFAANTEAARSYYRLWLEISTRIRRGPHAGA
jgi:cellulose biosynthesis protein BcsQ